MWPFTRKAKTVPTLMYVPHEHRERFCELHDKFRKTGGNADRLRLWDFIYEVMPEAKKVNGRICYPEATRPALEYQAPAKFTE